MTARAALSRAGAQDGAAPAGVRQVEHRLARLLIAVDATACGLTAVVGLLSGRTGLSLVAAIWFFTQTAGMRRDPTRRGILSLRHTALRAYGGLLPVVVIGASQYYDIEATVSAFAGLALVSLLARQSLHLRSIRTRLRLNVPCRVVLVGSPVQLERTASRFRAERGVDLVGVCVDPARKEYAAGRDLTELVLCDLADLPERVGALSIDQVRVLPGGLDEEELEGLAWELEATDAHLVLQTGLVGVSRERLTPTTVGGSGVAIRSFRADSVVQRIRAAVDCVAALVLLVVTAPLLLPVALAVRVGSTGPILFRQVRVGLDGTEFEMLKFRTMVVDAEARLADLVAHSDHGDEVLFKMQRDPRVTPVGRWLRATSLDELPQLINVIRGHMSLVGPRPALPREVERYDRRARRRLAVRPGLTGLWQVSGRSHLSWEDTVRIDLDYVDNWTAARDFRILAKTARVVLRRDGAY